MTDERRKPDGSFDINAFATKSAMSSRLCICPHCGTNSDYQTACCSEVQRLKLAMIEGEKQHLDRELEFATRAKEAEDRMMDMQVEHAAELQTLREEMSEGEWA